MREKIRRHGAAKDMGVCIISRFDRIYDRG